MSQTYESESDSLLARVMDERSQLAQELEAAIGNGASPIDAAAWQSQHASEIQAFRQDCEALSVQSQSVQLPYITFVSIPDDASQELGDLMTGQANLANDFIQIHNQQMQSLSAPSPQAMTQNGATPTSPAQIQENEVNLFEQRYAAEIAAQKERELAYSGGLVSLPMPPPFALPPSASPQMKAFLILRDQLTRSQIQAWNQNMSLGSSARNDAMINWQQQNAANLNQLHALAQNLSASN